MGAENVSKCRAEPVSLCISSSATCFALGEQHVRSIFAYHEIAVFAAMWAHQQFSSDGETCDSWTSISAFSLTSNGGWHYVWWGGRDFRPSGKWWFTWGSLGLELIFAIELLLFFFFFCENMKQKCYSEVCWELQFQLIIHTCPLDTLVGLYLPEDNTVSSSARELMAGYSSCTVLMY